MTRAEKISGGAVLLLLALASLLLLIQHITLARYRAAPTALQIEEIRVPVQGVARDDLVDTWGAARAGGRTHEGIDIIAPQGTPVLAATDGRIASLMNNTRGGVAIYQFDQDQNYVFYYAHLQRRAPGLDEGDAVREGQVIGYVGSTGNATTPHLHFELHRLDGETKYWQGEAVNPYPYLLSGEAPQ
ncbi:MAG: M23 family metallopeptidase [Hyphomonadaceae bacterium]|nr:M23 family metallopeptidase [Hyphomonadaceae bacterium]